MDKDKKLRLIQAFAAVQWGPTPFKRWELEALIRKSPSIYGFLGVFL